MANFIRLQLKRGPAQIIGLCECQAETEDLLRTPAVAGDKDGGVGLETKDGYEYHTLRGNEEKSVMLEYCIGRAIGSMEATL